MRALIAPLTRSYIRGSRDRERAGARPRVAQLRAGEARDDGQPAAVVVRRVDGEVPAGVQAVVPDEAVAVEGRAVAEPEPNTTCVRP